MARHGISRLRLRVGLLVTMLVLAACAPIYQNHGYVPSDEELALIEVGQDSRETVAATLGRPPASRLGDDVGWVYL
ncbi:hypothetical protein MASR2M74_24140 [Paracoccaceae bacterium]